MPVWAKCERALFEREIWGTFIENQATRVFVGYIQRVRASIARQRVFQAMSLARVVSRPRPSLGLVVIYSMTRRLDDSMRGWFENSRKKRD